MPPPDPDALTDGTVTVRPWRDSDVAPTHAGHDDTVRYWFGESEKPSLERWRDVVAGWRRDHQAGTRFSFVIEADGVPVGTVDVRRLDEGPGSGIEGSLSWWLYEGQRGHGYATRGVRVVLEWGLSPASDGGAGFTRLQAEVEPGNEPSLRVATRAGMRREGVRRVTRGTGDRAETDSYVVLARLADDPALHEPGAFRALLNSFLPRKRAIGQMLIRDPDDRVLLCQLTYKSDWDLPGGVVEVGESPQAAVTREVAEELALDVPAGRLLLTDWLPPWGGWDDAVCLVFDGGVHEVGILDSVVKQAREIRSVAFCDRAEIAERTADFTARRITAALAALDSGAAYTESGRPTG